MTAPLIEAISRALAIPFTVGGIEESWDSYAELAQAALTAITTAGYAIVPIEPTPEMIRAVDGEDSDKFVARGRAVSAYYIMTGEAMRAVDISVELP